MKKQGRTLTKLGPCVTATGHQFPKGGAEAIDFDYSLKTCMNCKGKFWSNTPFTPSIRNVTPSPLQIAERVRLAMEEDAKC